MWHCGLRWQSCFFWVFEWEVSGATSFNWVFNGFDGDGLGGAESGVQVLVKQVVNGFSLNVALELSRYEVIEADTRIKIRV